MSTRFFRPHSILWIMALPVLLAALAGSVRAADPAQDFQKAEPGYRYDFPRDHGSHDRFRTEWWYYTGNLVTEDGRAFGFQLTFFRRALPPGQIRTLPSRWTVSQLYLAHFAVSDLKTGQFYYAEKVSREGLGKAGAASDRLHVWIDRWSVDASEPQSDHHRLSASDHRVAIDLDLQSQKAPVVHGTGGMSRKGTESGQSSHYYSLTRLTTSGRVTIGHDTFHVTGESWMDHEFGSADLGNKLVGWDWFSVQLADRTELMLYRLRRTDGSADPVSSGTFIDRNGQTRHLSIQDFSLESSRLWTSPISQARYPLTWKLTVPSLDLSLVITPRSDQQELKTERSTQVTYWEGAITVEGSAGRAHAQGHGYMELTGYAERIQRKL
ncbi:lipocalin-like domain-containing protein [Nitrospira sp. KM1]|uniref:lipocalin-like domain-containing protein n=1 Tax=Nitrospira sp. KM1 TaxID=1936990 RepID=UPI0015676B8D|nr:lipocalin-like domain-containing protein [Nitrospira sp. KM1]